MATDFNVAIRTIQLYKGQAIYGVGGGITWVAHGNREYREVHQKAAVLYRKQARFQLITTGKISQRQLLFEEQHIERLRKASRYFAYPYDAEELRQKIEGECQACEANQDYRLRISLSKSGEVELSRQVLAPLSPDLLPSQTLPAGNGFESSFYLLQNELPTAFKPRGTREDLLQ